VSIVERIVTVYNDKGSKQAVKDLKKLEKDFLNAGKKIGQAFAVATVAVGAFAVKVGVDAVKGAMEDQKQQAALATALRNTTGATDAAIASTTAYLDQLELLVGVDNNELIPSLQILTTATRDVAQAQSLQALALDISAGASKDLGAVSVALARALGGNIGALTRLGVPLDANAVKAKDLDAILTTLSETFAGQAEKRAETFEFRMIKLQLAFNQIIDQIGYALIPVLEEFANYITSNVLPAIQEWVGTNKDQLAEGLKDVGTTLVTVGKLLAGFFKIIADNLWAVKAFAAIFIGAKLATGIYGIVTAIGLLRAAFVKQAAAATAAGTATAFATGGASAIAAAAAIGTFVVAAGAAYVAINKMTEATDKGSASTVQYNSHLRDLARVAQQVATANIKNNKIVTTTTTNTKLLTAAEKKAAEVRAAIKKAGLDKFGIRNVSDTDPIQLEAARLNLLKQNNLEEQRRLAAIIENMNAQMRANQAVQRYVDLLGVVADQTISAEEIILLAAKWGISQEAVVAYTTAVFAVNDAKLSKDEIDLLAKQWGVTKQQAEMYLDFFKYINDGKLDQTEINGLMDKWKLTSKEVKDYADKISKGVTPSDLWPTPGNQAAKSWRDALAALNAYIAAAGAKLVTSDAASKAATDAAAKAAADAAAKAAADAAAAAAGDAAAKAAAAAAAKAAADAAAKAAADAAAKSGADAAAKAAAAAAKAAADAAADAAAKAAAGVTPSALALEESGAIGAASIAAQIAAAEAAAAAAAKAAAAAAQAAAQQRIIDSIAFTDPMAQASLQSGLAGGASFSAALSGSRYAAQAAAQYGAGTTVNVTVQGSVTSENDLVASIRNGLLQGQNNGQAILKSAVAI
jgi:hypothetical protein